MYFYIMYFETSYTYYRHVVALKNSGLIPVLIHLDMLLFLTSKTQSLENKTTKQVIE
jgi:hypothetical protein